MREDHLSAEQVLHILDIVQSQDAILIGGQSINLWAEHYALADPGLSSWGPFTSKDVDFYRNRAAAERLTIALSGTLHTPRSIDDATPNAAKVVGTLDGKRIEIDFLARVLGVTDASIKHNCITLEGVEQTTGQPVRILLLHPLDCFRSRLSNLNTLNRRDQIAVNQAHASVSVLRCFIDDMLGGGASREVQRTLGDLEYVIRNQHVGCSSHLEHDVRPDLVLRHFASDPRLDPRWRERTLAPMIARVEDRLARAMLRRKR